MGSWSFLKASLLPFILVVGCQVLVSAHFMFYNVIVSRDRLGKIAGSKTVVEKAVMSGLQSPYLPCSIGCGVEPWCQMFCHDPNTNICTLMDMIVKPRYVETDMTDVLTCYTRLSNDYAIGATAGGVATNPYAPLSVVENLVDGVYGYIANDCYKSGYGVDPWFYVDLQFSLDIKSVVLLMQSNAGAQFQFDFEFRVHPDGSIPTDPATGQYFGYFSGPATPGERIEITKKVKDVRYITIQRFTPTRCVDSSTEYADCLIYVCHMEIY